MSTVAKFLKSTDGTDIYADAAGNPQHPSIVFVHGITFCSAVFDQLFTNKRLEKFYLVRYDMRGHGRSGKPTTKEGHSSLLYADDFATVVRAFNLEKPVFVGWSLGAAIIADICAHLHPLPIAAAVALSGPPLFHPAIPPISFTPACVSLRAGLVSHDTTLALGSRWDFTDACFRDPAGVPFTLRAAWVGYSVLQAPAQTELVSTREQDTSALAGMGRGDLKFLILCGDADKVVDGVAVAEEVKRGGYFGAVEVGVVVVGGGSHALFLDDEEATVDALVEFISRV